MRFILRGPGPRRIPGNKGALAFHRADCRGDVGVLGCSDGLGPRFPFTNREG